MVCAGLVRLDYAAQVTAIISGQPAVKHGVRTLAVDEKCMYLFQKESSLTILII